jgi:hypothetical protein
LLVSVIDFGAIACSLKYRNKGNEQDKPTAKVAKIYKNSHRPDIPNRLSSENAKHRNTVAEINKSAATAEATLFVNIYWKNKSIANPSFRKKPNKKLQGRTEPIIVKMR